MASGNMTIASGVSEFNSLVVANTNARAAAGWSLDQNNPVGAASEYSPSSISTVLSSARTLSPLGRDIADWTTPKLDYWKFMNAMDGATWWFGNFLGRLRLLKTSYPYSSYWYDVTNFAAIKYDWQPTVNLPPAPGRVGTPPNGAEITARVNALWAALNAAQWTDCGTFYEYYCHSNVHASHSSRSRR